MYIVQMCMYILWTCIKLVEMCMYHAQTCTYTLVLTSGAWHEVFTTFPHSTILQTLCRMLWTLSKFHFSFSPVLSGRFFFRRSRRLIASCCNSGSSDSRMPDWQDTMFHSMHWMSTSTISLLGSATWGNLYRRDQGLAASLALLMSKTWYIQVCTLILNIYTMYIHVQDVPLEQWGHKQWREESAWAFSCCHLSSLHTTCHQCKCCGNGLHTSGTRWSLRCLLLQFQSCLPTVSTLSRDGQL